MKLNTGLKRAGTALASLLSAAITTSLVITTTSFAMGKPKPTVPAGPVRTVANPYRTIYIRDFADVKPFEAPNSVTTSIQDSQNVLHELLKTELVLPNGVGGTATPFLPQDSLPTDASNCGTHLELQPAIIAFEMGTLQAKINFGYNMTGGIPVNVGQVAANATDTVLIGNIRLSFELYECGNAPGSNCTLKFASQADQTVLGNDLTFSISYGMITGGGDILAKTGLSNALAKIMAKGVNSLASNPLLAQLPWSSTIAKVYGDGSFAFEGGDNQNLKLTDYFTVYAKVDAVSQCTVLEALACVAPKEVSNVSSLAASYHLLSAGASRPIQEGDTVMVGAKECATAQ